MPLRFPCATAAIAAALVTSATAGHAIGQDLPAPPRDTGVMSDTSSDTATTAKRTGRARFFDPSDGEFDLSSFLEDPHGFLPVPVVVTEPAIGYGGGGVGMFLRPRKEAGDEGWSFPDISAMGAIATENGTRAGFAGDVSRWLNGRLRTLVGGGGGTVNLDFYGLGSSPAEGNQPVRYSLQTVGGALQANWQLAPRSPWAIGVRYVFANVEPRLQETAAFPGLVDRIRVKISAPTAILEFDTRNNVFTPTRGVYAETSYLASRESLGATVDFERFGQVLIGWLPLRDNVTLGMRAIYAWSSNGTPFFLRPYIQLRGVPAVRYQGDQAASLETEARWQFHGRWSVVVFAGTGKTWTSRDRRSFKQDVVSGGAGMRYELARKFGLQAGLDVAHSPGTNAVYFVVGNAWFRP